MVTPEIFKTELVNLVKDAEVKIDAALKDKAKNYPLSKPIYLYLSSMHIDSQIFSVLIPKYKAAGWTRCVYSGESGAIIFDYEISSLDLSSAVNTVTAAKDVVTNSENPTARHIIMT